MIIVLFRYKSDTHCSFFMIIYHISEIVNECDIANRKIQLYKTMGLSKSYMELDMDKIKDISGDLVDYIE